jgi:hypothetical protein
MEIPRQAISHHRPKVAPNRVRLKSTAEIHLLNLTLELPLKAIPRLQPLVLPKDWINRKSGESKVFAPDGIPMSLHCSTAVSRSGFRRGTTIVRWYPPIRCGECPAIVKKLDV